MPMATLKYPRTLTTQKHNFKKGIAEPISNEVASALINDPRFEIRGFGGDVADGAARLTPGVASGRPHVRAVRLEQIRTANSVLDPDVTENYTVDGKPSIAGLAKAMGWTPDQGEINEALRLKRRSGELDESGDSAAAQELLQQPDPAPVVAVSEVGASIIKDPIDDAAEAKLTLKELQSLPASTLPPNIKAVKRGPKVVAPPEEEKSAPI